MIPSSVLRLTLVFWGVWCLSTGFATQFLPLPVDELTRAADVILQGEVVSRTCDRDSRGRLTTRIELAVSEVWKGPSAEKLTVIQAGGTLGDQRQFVTGQPEYRIGEKVVAFLALNHAGEGVTLGLAHGKFSLSRPPGSPDWLATSSVPAPAGTLAITPLRRSLTASPQLMPPANGPPEPLSLRQLKHLVASTKP